MPFPIPPIGYKLYQEGEEIKNGYIVFNVNRWGYYREEFVGQKYSNSFPPLAYDVEEPIANKQNNMTPVPVGYKLCEEGEEIKSGYITYFNNNWVAGKGIWVGDYCDKMSLPMANLIIKSEIIKSEDDKLRDIVKATLKLYSIDILRKFVPDYELQDLSKETGLDLDTLVKIRDIVQGG